MARKTSDALLLAVLILVALAILVQGLVMKDVLANDFDGEEYTVSQYIDESLFKYPTRTYDKEVFEGHYSQYEKVIEEGVSIELFPENSFEQQNQAGIRNELTLDHYLYILEDTVEMYFSYSVITLNYHLNSGYGYDIGFSNYQEVINTRREYAYLAKRDIFYIAQYRLTKLDKGILPVYWGYDMGQLMTYLEHPSYNDSWRHFDCDTAVLLDKSRKIDDRYLKALQENVKSFRSIEFNRDTVPLPCKWGEVYAQSPLVVFNSTKETLVVFDIITKDAYSVFPDELIEQKVIEYREHK